jgi:hypothetical protein
MHKIFSNLKGFLIFEFNGEGFDEVQQHYFFLIGSGMGLGVIYNEQFSFGDGYGSGDGYGNGSGSGNSYRNGNGSLGEESLILHEEHYA